MPYDPQFAVEQLELIEKELNRLGSKCCDFSITPHIEVKNLVDAFLNLLNKKQN